MVANAVAIFTDPAPQHEILGKVIRHMYTESSVVAFNLGLSCRAPLMRFLGSADGRPCQSVLMHGRVALPLVSLRWPLDWRKNGVVLVNITRATSSITGAENCAFNIDKCIPSKKKIVAAAPCSVNFKKKKKKRKATISIFLTY